MSRMLRNILPLLIVVSASASGWLRAADEPSEMLARAEALYYEADFAKSIELLLRADELLNQQSGHMDQKTAVKLQLALGYIGLNDSARAKAYLGELYALDADHRIDPQVFSPKVIKLADEARVEQNGVRCRGVMDDAQRQLGNGNADAVVKLITSNSGKCLDLAGLNPKVADVLYKDGLDNYKKNKMEQAVQKFRSALRLEPKHELAAQYLELAQSKLEIAADRTLLAWRKNFSTGEFALAARDYRDLVSLSTSETVDEVRLEYRRALSNLADSWVGACANDDTNMMDEIRARVNALLPDPSFGEDIQARMKTCVHTRCIQMASQLALTRLKNRVDPQFSTYVLSMVKDSPVTVRVKAKISEAGDTAAVELNGGNALLYDGVRAAINQWKFSPAIVQGEARCVDTEIPMVLKFAER
jgi:tetratricopeptide (TPR) repeat protein